MLFKNVAKTTTISFGDCAAFIPIKNYIQTVFRNVLNHKCERKFLLIILGHYGRKLLKPVILKRSTGAFFYHTFHVPFASMFFICRGCHST